MSSNFFIISSNFFIKQIVVTAAMIMDIFVYKSEPILPFYLECNNNYTIGKKCLDGDMDSVFFV
jgi:hypothetical protein